MRSTMCARTHSGGPVQRLCYDRAMPQLVVQKYGGSSLADADRIRHVARRIARERAAGSDSWSW